MRTFILIGLVLIFQSCKPDDNWTIAIPGKGIVVNRDSILINKSTIKDLEPIFGIKTDPNLNPSIRVSDGINTETGEWTSDTDFVINFHVKSIDFEFSGNKQDNLRLKWITLKDTIGLKVKINEQIILGMEKPDILGQFKSLTKDDYISDDHLTFNFYSHGVSFLLDSVRGQSRLKEISIHYTVK